MLSNLDDAKVTIADWKGPGYEEFVKHDWAYFTILYLELCARGSEL